MSVPEIHILSLVSKKRNLLPRVFAAFRIQGWATNSTKAVEFPFVIIQLDCCPI